MSVPLPRCAPSASEVTDENEENSHVSKTLLLDVFFYVAETQKLLLSHTGGFLHRENEDDHKARRTEAADPQ